MRGQKKLRSSISTGGSLCTRSFFTPCSLLFKWSPLVKKCQMITLLWAPSGSSCTCTAARITPLTFLPAYYTGLVHLTLCSAGGRSIRDTHNGASFNLTVRTSQTLTTAKVNMQMSRVITKRKQHACNILYTWCKWTHDHACNKNTDMQSIHLDAASLKKCSH